MPTHRSLLRSALGSQLSAARLRLSCALALAAAVTALRAQTIIDNTTTPTLGAFDTTGNNLTLSGTATGTASGVISGSGTLTKNDVGTWTLSAANTFTGTTTISAGTLSFTGSGGLPNSAVTIEGGATLFTGAFNSATIGSISGAGAVVFSYGGLYAGGNNASTTFSGSISNSGTLVKTGTGTLTFNGSTPGGGQLSVSGGTLIFAPSSSANYDGPVSAQSGGTLIVAPPDPAKFVSHVSVYSGGSATIALPNSTPLGTTDITVNSGGSLTLSETYKSTALAKTTLYVEPGASLSMPSEGVVLGGLTNYSGGTITITPTGFVGFPNLTVGANDISSSFGGNLTFTGAFSATNPVKIGTGTWTLTSAVNFAPLVTAGYVVLESAAAGTGIQLRGGGLRYNASMTHTGGISPQTGGGTVDTGSNNVTVSGTVTNGSTGDANALVKLGSGTLTLSGTNTFVSVLAINAGTVAVSQSANLGYDYDGFSSAIRFGGGTLRTTGSFTSVYRPVTLASGGGTFEVANATTLTWNGVISGASGNNLTKTGPGTLVLGTANTYSGATTISAGTLNLSGSGDLPNSAVTVASGATLATSGGDSPFNSASYDIAALSGSGAVSIGSFTNITVGANHASTTFSGNLSGNGSSSITKTGNGTFTFTGTTTNSVSLLASQGSLVFSPSNAADYLGTVGAIGGGSVTVAPSDPSKFKGALYTQPGGALTLNLPNSTPLAAYSVYLTGGSLTLTGHDSTALSQTTLDLHGTTVNLPGSSLTLGGLSSSGTNTFVFNNQYGGLDLTVGGNNGNSYFYDTFSPQNTASSNFGFPSNSIHVTKVGTGTLALGGAVSFQTVVQAGYAEIYSGGGENNGFGLNGGGLRYGSPMTHTGSIYVMTGGGTIDTGSNDVTMAGYLDGESGVSVPLTKIGSGTLTLTGSNYFAGTLAINAGTLSVSANDKLGYEYPDQFSRVTLGGGTLRTTASFTSDHPMTLASGSGTLDVVSGTTLTWTGAITGTNGNTLTKTGAGTLTLNAANTYVGGTTISFGTVATGHATALGTGPVTVSGATAILALNGNLLANTVNLTNGGTLSGSGSVGSLSAGGRISPGASPGTLAAGATTFAPGGSYLWEINNATGTAGTHYDLLSITGALNITATSGNPFTIHLTSLLANNTAGNVINFNSSTNSHYTIASASSGITGFSTSAFTLNTTGFTNALNGGTWSLGTSGNDLNLTFTASAIPEPSTYAAIFGAAALALAAYRRRKK